MEQKRINLLPKDKRPKLEIPKEYIPIILFGIAIVYICYDVSHYVLKKKSQTRKLAQVQQEYNKSEKDILSLTQSKNKIDSSAQAFQSLDDLINKKPYWSEAFKELSIMIPKHVWLKNLIGSESKSGSGKIVLSGETTSQQNVAEFYAKLEKSFYFKKVNINFSQKVEDMQPSLYQFQFTIPVALSVGGG